MEAKWGRRTSTNPAHREPAVGGSRTAIQNEGCTYGKVHARRGGFSIARGYPNSAGQLGCVPERLNGYGGWFRVYVLAHLLRKSSTRGYAGWISTHWVGPPRAVASILEPHLIPRPLGQVCKRTTRLCFGCQQSFVCMRGTSSRPAALKYFPPFSAPASPPVCRDRLTDPCKVSVGTSPRARGAPGVISGLSCAVLGCPLLLLRECACSAIVGVGGAAALAELLG